MDLLRMTPAGGCASKLPLERMNSLMGTLDHMLQLHTGDQKIRVDSRSRDDAALYETSANHLLAASVDFGTPVSASPKTWGRIATLNALSDIYAMGAKPFLALSILAWPPALAQEVVTALLDEVLNTLAECETHLVGGHSLTSEVPMFGLCVLGTVSSTQVMLLENASPGDNLIITKPIGTGIIVAGQKYSIASADSVEEAERVMTSSNKRPAELAVDFGVDAATDVTGFGLIGHLQNMLTASHCSAEVMLHRIPVIPGAIGILDTHGIVPDSAEQNYFYLERSVSWSGTPMAIRLLLCDPQTSGGLILAADPEQSSSFLDRCHEEAIPAAVIGRVKHGAAGSISIIEN